MSSWNPLPPALLLCGVFLAGCSKPPAPAPAAEQDVLARVGGRTIRLQDFQEAALRRAVGADPAARQALLEEMIGTAVLLERARELGLDQDPAVRRAWENLLIGRLRERELDARLTNAVPTPAQVQARYETNRAAYTEPARRRGAVLFLGLPARPTAELKSRLRERLAEARLQALALATNDPSARGFGALAIEYSEDQPTRYRGGDFGWVEAGRRDARFDPAVVETLFQLAEPGSVSDVLETPRGFHLVKLLEARPERVKPLDQVRPAIEHVLLIENRRQVEDAWKQGLAAALRIERFPDVLARLPATGTAGVTSNTPPPGLP